MALYNAMGTASCAEDMSALSRISAPPKQMVADNGYATAADEIETIGVVSVG